MSEPIEHSWGQEYIIKKNDSCLIRILKLRSGCCISLHVEPEMIYLQSGSLLCVETGMTADEGVGDLSVFGIKKNLNFIALSNATIYETRYFTSKL